MKRSFAHRYQQALWRTGTPVVVGLDPRLELLPEPVREAARHRCADPPEADVSAVEEFCTRVIDVVGGMVPAVKPQAAFFEKLGPAGMAVLGRIIRKARDAGLLVILDGKRGDIGSTASAYAEAYLAGEDADAAPWAADALTVHPYLGGDALQPFVERATERGAGLFVLVRTSNPGATDLQEWRNDQQVPLYEHVAEMVEALAEQTAGEERFGPVGAVVGATWPEQLVQLRAKMPHVLILVPGYGAQGGTAADVAGAFFDDGTGALVNASRSILFAYAREPYKSLGPRNWEQAVEAATREMIEDLAAHTPAGRLRTRKTD